MTVVRSQLIDLATGLPARRVRVYARLVGSAAWLRGQSAQITGAYETVSGEDGWYELQLPPQSSYEVEGTYYAVREWENATWNIQVPEFGPVALRDCLVDAPPEIAPYSPISTFDTLRDVNPFGRDVGDIVAVGEDGKLGYVPKSAAVAAPNWYSGEGPPPQVIAGASPHDIYVDRLTGTFYILE